MRSVLASADAAFNRVNDKINDALHVGGAPRTPTNGANGEAPRGSANGGMIVVSAAPAPIPAPVDPNSPAATYQVAPGQDPNHMAYYPQNSPSHNAQPAPAPAPAPLPAAAQQTLGVPQPVPFHSARTTSSEGGSIMDGTTRIEISTAPATPQNAGGTPSSAASTAPITPGANSSSTYGASPTAVGTTPSSSSSTPKAIAQINAMVGIVNQKVQTPIQDLITNPIVLNQSNADIWASKGLIDWKFRDFNITAFEEPGKMKRAKWLLAVVLALNYLWGLVANAILIRTMSKANQPTYAILYAIAWAIEIIVVSMDSYTAYKVVKTDDVSDSFQNLEATRWLTIRSFAHYCFITKVSALFSTSNKVVFWFYKTLRDWKRLVVTVIQVILAVTYWADTTSNDDETTDSSGNTTTTTDDEDLTWKDVSIILKLVTASISCFAFIFAFVLYPCFRCYVASEVRSLHMTAEQYCSLKFEERLNQVMVEHYKAKGLPPPTRESVNATKTGQHGHMQGQEMVKTGNNNNNGAGVSTVGTSTIHVSVQS